MIIDNTKVKKITVIKGGQRYQCKRAKLTTGQIVFKSDFNVTVNCYEIKTSTPYERDYKLKTVIEPFDSTENIHVKIIAYDFYNRSEVVKLDEDVTNAGKTIEWHNEWGGAGGNFRESNVKSIEITHGAYTETVTIPYRNPQDVSETTVWREYYTKTFTVVN